MKREKDKKVIPDHGQRKDNKRLLVTSPKRISARSPMRKIIK
jgi:hypothetical protein